MLNQYLKLKKKLPGLTEGVSLRRYCTLQVGGIADYLYEADKLEDLIKAVKICHQLEVKCYILGQGSNVIPSENGFEGVVIINRTSRLVVIDDRHQLMVDSGVPLARAVIEAANHNLNGLENIFTIPGTIGGAVFGNAGWRGRDIGQLVKNATLLEIDGEVRSVNTKWLGFGYRTSRIKEMTRERRPVILTVLLQLSRGKKEEIIAGIAQARIFRQTHQPVGIKTSGSIFKNPSGNTAGVKPTLSAGYLLESAGAKKLHVGDARVCPHHANWIENRGRATAVDIRKLIEQMRKLVEEKYKIILEEEVEYFGRW